MKHTQILLLLSLGMFLLTCSKEEQAQLVMLDLPEEPYHYEGTQVIPNGLGFSNQFTPNPVTDHGATLGRVLFFDTRLSLSNKTSCSSCHKQEFGFADNKARSQGFFVMDTRRNSPGLANMRHQPDFFWDARVDELEEQVILPIQDHIEMGITDEEQLLTKLSGLSYYPPLFEAAFGTSAITQERVSFALAQFIKSLTSYHTKFDLGVISEFENFNEAERRGKDLFFEELPCASCHSGSDLGGWGSANIGLDMHYEDGGIAEVQNNESANGWFSIPNLRNVTRTAPYMHDGRFQTLEEVIDHYAVGVQDHPSLSFSLIFGGWNANSSTSSLLLPNSGGSLGPMRFQLTSQHIQDIIAFLGTLEDQEMMSDERFSNPFKSVE